MIILFCVAIWLTSGFIAAGFVTAYFADEFPLVKIKASDGWITVAFGIGALIGTIELRHYTHGWRKWW